jgi:hypothetical protein
MRKRARWVAGMLLWVAGGLARSAGAADQPPPPQPAAQAPMRVDCVEYRWNRGDPPVRMIRKDEGVCYLAQVQGKFAGAGESVGVYVDDDGYWYLSGASGQEGVAASAIAVRFPGKWVVNVARAPSGRVLTDLGALSKSDQAAVREAAAEELKPGAEADPETQFARATTWLTLAEKDASPLKGYMTGHAIDLLRSAAPALSEALAAKATKLADEHTVAFAAKHLNDLAHWDVAKGTWEATPDGKIRGAGDSGMTFRVPLPADGEYSFHVMVLEGMRPRVSFGGTGLTVGNEGYERVLDAHGAQAQRGVKFPYRYGQDLRVTVRFDGPDYEVLIGGELTSKGTRKTVPPSIKLRLSGGDDWSKGACLFWGLEYKPAKAAAEKKP